MDNNDKAAAEERDYKAEKATDAAIEAALTDAEKQAEVIQVNGNEAPPTQPEQRFQKLDFNAMPGVSLLVPEGTPPVELIRIAATICEEVGVMVVRKVTNALLG